MAMRLPTTPKMNMTVGIVGGFPPSAPLPVPLAEPFVGGMMVGLKDMMPCLPLRIQVKAREGPKKKVRVRERRGQSTVKIKIQKWRSKKKEKESGVN